MEKFFKYESAHSPNVISCPLRIEGRVWLSLACKRSLRTRCASFQSSVPVDSLWRCPILSRYCIHQSVDPVRLNKPPSCFIGRAISHLLFESCAEGLKIRFEEPNVAAHHAEMGNLLSLNPKIHRLRTDAQIQSGVTNGEWALFGYECVSGGRYSGASRDRGIHCAHVGDSEAHSSL